MINAETSKELADKFHKENDEFLKCLNVTYDTIRQHAEKGKYYCIFPSIAYKYYDRIAAELKKNGFECTRRNRSSDADISWR